MSLPPHPQFLYAIYQLEPESGEWHLLLTVTDRATKDKSMEFYGMGHTLHCITYTVLEPS